MATPSEVPSLPVPWPENAEIKVYTGGCHCKAIRYEFSHPDIYSMPVVNCNCTICENRGYLNVFTYAKDFRFTKGSADDMTTYAFGDCKIIHRFCPTCGTSIGPTFPAKAFVVVNTRTIDDIDIQKLQLKPVDGKSWPSGPGTKVGEAK
ncbi:Mss4-like protein [Mycena rosella]|uniref:Mss4-like protein n=1 Tax=Mycena rosella TaxID=1033263 RepID=A0AAD7DPB8_MYCRO|nr:Mss4-like protein [Mycena rosella]